MKVDAKGPSDLVTRVSSSRPEAGRSWSSTHRMAHGWNRWKPPHQDRAAPSGTGGRMGRRNSGLTTTSGPFGRVLEGPIRAATHDSILVVGNAKGDVVATSTTGMRWQTRVPGPVLHHPSLNGDRAYIAYGAHDARHGGLRALDLETGDVIWETRLRSRPSGPPALGPHVIIADSNAEVLALDLGHGGIRWRAPTPSTVAGQPTIQSDAIYISRHDGHIDRMDMADGGTVWSLDVGGAATGQMCQTDSGIVLGTADGRIIGLGTR